VATLPSRRAEFSLRSGSSRCRRKPPIILLLSVLAATTLASAAGPVVLTDDVYQLAPGDWRWVRFDIRQRAATVICGFQSSGGEKLHAEIVNRSELDAIRQRKSHGALAQFGPAGAGYIRQLIQDPGEYAAVIENKDTRPAAAHITVALDLTPPRSAARTLSPTRRLTVIIVSFVCFFAIVTFSARALLRAMRRS
jgi:hypothetical protein